MRKLFKSAFKSLGKSKVGLILLSIIVFLTAGTFTLFNSASNAFKQSYNQVMQDGTLHDFTVKEKYSIKGDVDFDLKPDWGNAISSVEIDSSKTSDPRVFYDQKTNEKYFILDFDDLKGSGVEVNKIKKTGGIFGFGGSWSTPKPITNVHFAISEKDININKNGVLSLNSASKLKLLLNNYTTTKKLLFWELKENHSDPSFDINNRPNGSSYSLINIKNGIFKQEYKKNEKIEIKNLYANIAKVEGLLNNYFKVTNKLKFLKPNLNFNGEFKTTKKTDDIIQSKLSNEYLIINDNELNSKKLDKSNIDKVTKLKQDILADVKKDIFKDLKENKSDEFVKSINKIYGTSGSKGHLLDIDKVESMEVNSNQGSRKIISVDNNRKLDKIVKFDGYNMPDPILNKKWKISDKINISIIPNNIDLITYLKNKSGSNKNISIVNKGYKISLSSSEKLLGNTIPHASNIIDPTSFLAYVSPTYVKQNNIKFTNPKDIISDYTKYIKTGNPEDWIAKVIKDGKYKDSIVKVDNTYYIAIGSAITPDFAYPIIGPDRPLPDTKNEALLFTNQNGFNRIEDAFRGNDRENYLAFKFTDKVKDQKTKDAILKKVEEIASQQMSWGQSVNHIVSKAFDTSENVILAPHRVSFLNKLQSNISTLSIVLTVALGIFIIIAVSLVIKKYINSHKKNYGILMANGYSKWKISIASTIIAMITIIVPAALGYVTGHFMQYVLIGQFNDVWTLPITGHEFNWWALTSIVLFPFIVGALLAFVITMWELRGTIPEILSGQSSKIAASLSAKVLGPLKYIGIKTKASMSLFITNLSKMLLIFVSSAMAIITISVSISTIHKFDQAKTTSAAATSYTYDVTYTSPTTEGGLFSATHLYELGGIGHNNDDINQNQDLNTTLTSRLKQSPLNNISNKNNGSEFNKNIQNNTFMFPTSNDKDFQNNPIYLKNLIQTKALLNVFLGLGSMGANPWELAKKMMPENQLNYSNQKYDNFIKFAIDNYKKKNNNNLPNFIDPNTKKIIPDKIKTGLFNMNLTDEFKKFFIDNYIEAYKQYKNTGKLDNMPYFITYNSVLMGNNDETYTAITGYTQKGNFKNNTNKHNFDIKGVKENSKYINLSKGAYDALKHEGVKNNTYPVIVNKYFKEFYKVGVGDVINYTVTNHKDRYKNGPSGLITKDIKLKIVGIQNSYNDQKVYTLQKYAQEALGWTGKGEDKMFNGVFTKETGKDSVLLNNLSLYSPSGVYPGTDKIANDSNNPITKNIINYIQSNKGLYPNVQNLKAFKSTYSLSPYVTFTNVDWADSAQFRFSTTSNLSKTLIFFIESITIILSAMFIIIIALMMIDDNKKFIATLKVMGYKSREIFKIFFGSFIPSFIFATILAGPLAFGVAEIIRHAIMSFGSILIPISLTWWTVLLAFGITLIGSLITFWASTRSLKNTKMLQAFTQ